MIAPLNKVVNFKYVPIDETTRRNGYRHEFKGYYWLELGYDDRAAGSFRKAKREFKKADEFKNHLKVDWLIDDLVGLLSNQIADSVMNSGSGNGGLSGFIK